MPVGVGDTTVLTGSDGAILFTPAGTEALLLDFSDFPAGNTINVPNDTDFRVGDAVVFSEEGASSLDTALTSGTTYYVVAVNYGVTPATISVAATAGGSIIAMNGDGGTAAADTPGAHIKVALDKELLICEVASVEISFDRGEVDTTSLPCDLSNAGVNKIAQFRTYQAGYADGNGTMVVRFTRGQESIANRVIQGALFTSQAGAKLTVALEAFGAVGGGLDYAKSQAFSFPVSLLGFGSGLTPEDTPTEATIRFRLAGQPTEVLGLAL